MNLHLADEWYQHSSELSILQKSHEKPKYKHN